MNDQKLRKMHQQSKDKELGKVACNSAPAATTCIMFAHCIRLCCRTVETTVRAHEAAYLASSNCTERLGGDLSHGILAA